MAVHREISTPQGVLRGVESGGVFTLLGVRYGDDTAGANRFRAPRLPRAWDGVRDAVIFGPSAPQIDNRDRLGRLMHPRNGSPLEGGPTSEDCLRLNIWAPAARTGEELPVLVWLHGGGYLAGSGNEMWFNGDVLAATEEVVIVTVTHRLGILGFLDLRAEGLPDSAHAGMLDIVMALQWVRDNISSVGGDPSRVTIAGQSGGGAKVAALCAMPAATDLFARAIMMSGPFPRVLPQTAASEFRDRVVGAAEGGVASLLDVPVDDLIHLQADALAAAGLSFGPESMESSGGIGPTLDAVHLPEHPFWPVATPRFTGKQLLIGWTTHEVGSLFAADPRFTVDLTADEAIARLTELGVPRAEAAFTTTATEVLDERPHLVFARVLSSMLFEGPARDLASIAATVADSVWAYEFREMSDVLDGLVGSCHSLDIPYVFGTVERIPLVGVNPYRATLSREMSRAWVRFATVGIPEADTEWLPWNDDERFVHAFACP
ncbi:carboxylesterase family protein (plasmid) [Rathayibacter sp. VKM Ac-2803]|uniref:Carboxylesterase type B domain-containing protein n=1 Tax=Rathayibacter caricis DSM 15933 TaxID=1328867 RepID=A0A2T4UPA8_9MICO|nr:MULTISPECIES: carboxylesterase family protein [Rathayibacter]MWV51543.1 carboxylesterase family protein [Rathayibacter sp. VKM Ac-2803]PTL71363.1 hypothetical protein C1I63_19280 [Rathayibacter caricis DSM 15933]